MELLGKFYTKEEIQKMNRDELLKFAYLINDIETLTEFQLLITDIYVINYINYFKLR